jgi:hypothetical protein
LTHDIVANANANGNGNGNGNGLGLTSLARRRLAKGGS